MTGSTPKKQCDRIMIGTHDGTFHCDEVLACWMLKQLPKFKRAEIIRTRDAVKLSQCDIVVDVGGIYDPENQRFDHHQRSFNGTMKSLGSLSFNTKLSSAGLVYLHMGKEVLAEVTETSIDDPSLPRLYEKGYEKFIDEIDAIDNGIDPLDGRPRCQVTTTLSSRVGGLNPPWNVKDPDVQSAFDKAMDMCGAELLDRIMYYKESWWPARKLVEDAISDRFEVDPSGEIIMFHSSGCPWKEHLFDIEIEKHVKPQIKFIIYQDQHHHYRVQCVPKKLGSFENRLSLLEKWRGVRDEALSTLSGIPGCIFVHANGFIGGNKTFEGARKMAKVTLESASS